MTHLSEMSPFLAAGAPLLVTLEGNLFSGGKEQEFETPPELGLALFWQMWLIGAFVECG